MTIYPILYQRGILTEIAKKNISGQEFFGGLFWGWGVTWYHFFEKNRPKSQLGTSLKIGRFWEIVSALWFSYHSLMFYQSTNLSLTPFFTNFRKKILKLKKKYFELLHQYFTTSTSYYTSTKTQAHQAKYILDFQQGHNLMLHKLCNSKTGRV